MIDVIITERGIAVNPLRKDLIKNLKGKKLPLASIKELREEAERICGKPDKPVFDERIVAAVKWVDGTVIDSIKKIKN
jgi:citrate lyase subunit alpha/citrate CoA-transferase